MNCVRNRVWPIAALLLTAATAAAQAPMPPSAAQPVGVGEAPPASDKPDFRPEELEQMLAPIALYPDSLISQILMAATYPIEVVEADRWAKANASLKGDALALELEKKTWDPSVRSLVNFPLVLAMMSENLSTTVKIGDAFIGQQKAVMDTIQKLRAKAKSTGNLESNQQQKVVVQESAGTQVIVVESSSPEIVYVPQYNPIVVYGAWPYPAYPPYPYYPPGYVATAAISFGVGVAVGAAWGYAWGNCNWHGGDVDIDINRNTNINNNINRNNFQNNRGQFKHDPAHRQGAAYRNQSAANRVGAGTTSNRAAQARTDYRGRADAGRQDINRGGADSFKGRGDNRAPSAPNRDGNSGAGSRGSDLSLGQRSNSSGSSRGSAISDANRGGQQARQASNRGTTSRQSSPSAASRPSGSRSSGGASRGGGRGGGGRR